MCQTHPPDCVLRDYRLPDLDGLAFLTALASTRGTNIPAVVLTGQGNKTIVVDVVNTGAVDYMPKHVVSAKALARSIANTVNQSKLRAALEEQSRLLEQTNQDLLHKQEEISSFYHMPSHEMKMPLTAIWESVAIVLDTPVGPLTEQQRRHLYLHK